MIEDMIAFSQGMLRSVKLAVFESQVDEIIMPMKDIIDTLASTGKIYAGIKTEGVGVEVGTQGEAGENKGETGD